MGDRYDLHLPALELAQGSRRIYLFAVDGKRLHDFTAVSRVRREPQANLQGYQRPEVQSHIRAIRRYLESETAMLPNAVVLAFDDRVHFEPADTLSAQPYARPGELVVPVDETLEEAQKPAWLVDGQQRAAAIRDADIAEFPLPVVGFIAHGEAEQRAQFILVNSTKPLPKGLIHELLPETETHLPPRYARRKLPASLLAALNTDPYSPFCGLIATPTTPDGYIKDNSVLKMLENSIYEGALYQYRNPTNGEADSDHMLRHLNLYWTLVSATWPDAWELPPRKSRLTHGVGIQALGYLMDSLTDGIRVEELNEGSIQSSLRKLRNETAWTSGTWHLAPDDTRRWNGLQNTPNDVRLLSNLLLQVLRARKE